MWVSFVGLPSNKALMESHTCVLLVILLFNRITSYKFNQIHNTSLKINMSRRLFSFSIHCYFSGVYEPFSRMPVSQVRMTWGYPIRLTLTLVSIASFGKNSQIPRHTPLLWKLTCSPEKGAFQEERKEGSSSRRASFFSGVILQLVPKRLKHILRGKLKQKLPGCM